MPFADASFHDKDSIPRCHLRLRASPPGLLRTGRPGQCNRPWPSVLSTSCFLLRTALPASISLIIVNFTGDPAASGFALPPDFPVLTFVTLQEATLLFNGTGASITLPDIAPGQLDSGSAPQFSGDALFTSALFTATLSETTFLLDGGGIFTADPTLSAMLLPSSGPNLIAGTDVVVLQATGTLSGSETPEPGSAALIAVSIVAALGARRAFMRLRY